mmetsp:Transcript_12631/g.20583  ORF Transcript_12631/g.20583 Transcript_12631/m.20583 type:complete len:300 (+) Transcript_12631:234-1133(+)
METERGNSISNSNHRPVGRPVKRTEMLTTTETERGSSNRGGMGRPAAASASSPSVERPTKRAKMSTPETERGNSRGRPASTSVDRPASRTEALPVNGSMSQRDHADRDKSSIKSSKTLSNLVVVPSSASQQQQQLPTRTGTPKQRMVAIFKAIRETRDEHGRSLCSLFKSLPSASDYPDYYKIISNPIDLRTIMEKLNADRYRSIEEFKKDFDLLFSNAQTYNMPGSQVFLDSKKLQRVFLDKYNSTTSSSTAIRPASPSPPPPPPPQRHQPHLRYRRIQLSPPPPQRHHFRLQYRPHP